MIRSSVFPPSTLRAALLAALALAPAPLARADALAPDDAATQLLATARRAYNEHQYPVAADRFREFLKIHANHKNLPDAQLGLAIALLDTPDRDPKAALEAVQPLLSREGFPQRPLALATGGEARRMLAAQAIAQIPSKPNEAAQLKSAATGHLTEAARLFASAAKEYAAAVKSVPAPDATLPPDLEASLRARCDQADVLIRLAKYPEAADAVAPLLSDAALAKSASRPLALYLAGYAQFAQADYLSAGRSLSQLAPFTQDIGPHARFLLARSHHLSGQLPEASAQYKALLADVEARRKSDPNRPAPEFFPRVGLYLATLAADDNRYAEAVEPLAAFISQNPKSPLLPEAQLRLAWCHLQLKNAGEALRISQLLKDNPAFADQADWYAARAALLAVDPAKPETLEPAALKAIESLRRAADRASELARTDADAKVRRAGILLDLADAQLAARKFPEAASTCQQIITDNAAPDRVEQASERQVTALHLARQYAESDAAATRFEAAYPRSILLASVLFRAAENANLQASDKSGDERKTLSEQAITRYQRVLDKYPEFQQISAVRNGLGIALYRLGKFDQAADALALIPDIDRSGELAAAPHVAADAILRTLPPETEDALSAARLADRCEQAAQLLAAFIAANPKSREAPDALLKFAHANIRQAGVLADREARLKLLTLAREALDRLTREFPKEATNPSAIFERGKCLALLGDTNAATAELSRFQKDLANTPPAPLATVRLASMMRAQAKAPDAVLMLKAFREQQESALAKDPARAPAVPLLKYEQALALKESSRASEACELFEAIARDHANSPHAANATWRAAQCRRDELTATLAAAKLRLAQSAFKPDDLAAARKAIESCVPPLRSAADTMATQAQSMARAAAADKSPNAADAASRTLYEAAWLYRGLDDALVTLATQQRQAADLGTARARLAQASADTSKLRPAEVPPTTLPASEAENRARDLYTQVIAVAPDAPVAVSARFDLAELLARAGEVDRALDLLTEALDHGPAPELAQRIRLRLAVLALTRNDTAAALIHARAIASDKSSPFAAEARLLAGEVALQQGNFARAAEILSAFRDPFKDSRSTADRGLLRLSQALLESRQYDPARQAAELLIQRFADSPFADEARLTIGLTLQAQQQFDPAINAFTDITRRTASELGARAQYQVGLCRFEQKRFADAATALLVVPLAYDYPEWSARARCDAARAFSELKNNDEARRLLERVLKDHPKTQWSAIAQQRLTELK